VLSAATIEIVENLADKDLWCRRGRRCRLE